MVRKLTIAFPVLSLFSMLKTVEQTEKLLGQQKNAARQTETENCSSKDDKTRKYILQAEKIMLIIEKLSEKLRFPQKLSFLPLLLETKVLPFASCAWHNYFTLQEHKLPSVKLKMICPKDTNLEG